MTKAVEQWASGKEGFLRPGVIGKVDLEAQKGRGWGRIGRGCEGGRELRRGFWLVGAFGGAVEIRWALSAAEELNGSSNHCSCGLRVSTAAHARPPKEISTQGLGWNKDHALFVVSLLGP